MSSWLRTSILQAGLRDSIKLRVLGLLPVLVAFAVVQDLLKVTLLSAAVALGVLAVELEALGVKARARVRQIEDEWPSVIESLESAAQAGLGLLESLRDIAESSQLVVANEFAELCNECDSGVRLDVALERLKNRLALPCSDLTVETLRLANDSGSEGYQQTLHNQAKTIRERTALNQQILAKQGWVLGTAKVAVTAPWLIVALLAMRSENAEVYNSDTGSLLLATGLFASFVAIRLIAVMGRLDTHKRVLA